MNAAEKSNIKRMAADLLREAHRNGLSDKDAARICQRSTVQVGRYLVGECLPSPKVAARIVKALKEK